MAGNSIIPLNQLPIGATGVVQSLLSQGLTRRRMMDLGLTPGARVEAVRVSPTGDPKAYKVRGAMLAFRQEESCKILVRYRGNRDE